MFADVDLLRSGLISGRGGYVGDRRCGSGGAEHSEADDDERCGVEGVDSGSAVAEFALVASLLALILAGALQIGLVIHVRNTVIDSAIAGARQASLADQSPRDGQRLTAELIRVSIGERYAQKVTVSTSQRGQVNVVEVSVSTPLPVLGLWGPAEVWELSGRSVVEDIDRD